MKIKANSNEEYKLLAPVLEAEGRTWVDGDLPTKWKPSGYPTTICLNPDNNTFYVQQTSRVFDCTVLEYLNRGGNITALVESNIANLSEYISDCTELQVECDRLTQQILNGLKKPI